MRARYTIASVVAIFVFPVVSLAQGTWTTLPPNSLSWRFEDLFFVNADVGWAVDGGGQILKTTNGGDSWTQQFHDSNFYFRSVAFFDEQVGFAGTLSSALFRTADGGATWTNINASLPVVPAGICGMSIANDSTIYITGIFYSPAYFMKSTDRGLTWTHTSMSAQAFTLVDVHFKDSDVGFLVGGASMAGQNKAVILRTDNGGASWTTVGLGPHSNERAWKIQFVNDLVGFVSVEELSPEPQYFKTTDGGATWVLHTVTPTIPTGTVQGIGFLTEDHGWVGGFNDLLFETLDGGGTWTYQPAVGQSYNRFWRMSDTVMYVAGRRVYRYDADGTTVGMDGVDDTPLPGHGLSLVGANPASDHSLIALELINDTYVELSVHRTDGALVERIQKGMRAKGTHRIPWDHSHLAPGAYLLALYTYHGYQTIRVVVQ